jgi:uncharacterized caspase-like protein
VSRRALFIATSSFLDGGLSRLASPGHDVSELHDVLADPQVGNFQIDLIVNAEADTIRRLVEQFFLIDASSDDLLLLFYSGHGLKDESGRLYFAATNTSPSLLRSTGISADFINEVMGSSRARQQVVVLDCCYSGAFGRGMTAKADHTPGLTDSLAQSAGRGRVVLTASNAVQYSFESLDTDVNQTRSLYTAALVDGLRTGEADLDGDGVVMATEWHEYALRRVRDANPNQQPRMWAFDLDQQPEVARVPSDIKEVRATAAPIREQEPTLPTATKPTKKWLAVSTLGAALALVIGLSLSLSQGDDSPETTQSQPVGEVTTTTQVIEPPAASSPTTGLTETRTQGATTGLPSLHRLNLEDRDPLPGESMTITIEARNAAAVDAVFFRRPSGVSATLEMTPFASNQDVFTANIDLPDNTASGQWLIETIVLRGNDGVSYHFIHPANTTVIDCADGFQDIGTPACDSETLAEFGEFEVGGNNTTLENPLLHGVIFEPNQVAPGEEFVLKVEVDFAEEIRTVFFAFEPTGDTVGFEVIPFLPDETFLTARITVPGFVASGTYRVSELIVTNAIGEDFGFLNIFIYPSSDQCPDWSDLGARFSCASLTVAEPGLEVVSP